MGNDADKTAILGGTLLGLAALSRSGGGGGQPPTPPPPVPLPTDQLCRDGSGTVTTSSRVIFGANPRRILLTVVNDGDDTVYVCFADTATAHTGKRLNANGGSLVVDRDSMWFGTISVVSLSTDSAVTAEETYAK